MHDESDLKFTDDAIGAIHYIARASKRAHTRTSRIQTSYVFDKRSRRIDHTHKMMWEFTTFRIVYTSPMLQRLITLFMYKITYKRFA